MKQINQFITEYIIKKKLDKPIDSSGYKYHPQTKQELINNINKINFDVSRWDVSKVENMEFMFCDCVNFTGKGLEKWNVSKANTYYMLYNCHNFKNKPSWYKE